MDWAFWQGWSNSPIAGADNDEVFMNQPASPYLSSYLSSPGKLHSNSQSGELIKRVLDCALASIGIPLLMPLFLYLSWRIRRDSPGPIFYRGARVGKNGKIFHILKFRTMYERPASYQGPQVTAQDDPRITPLGRWLRATKLNELPQLWNVLKGEMSLVGPRPEDPQIVASWPEPVRQEILSVRPGITSPASVIYHDEEHLLSSSQVMEAYLDKILPSKLRLDQLYVRHRSLLGDLDVLFWTLLIMLPQVKSYSPGEERLFSGPLTKLVRRHIRWLVIDTTITFLAMGVTGLFWRSLNPLNVGLTPAVILALGFSFLFSLTNAALRVNRIEWSRAAANDALDLAPGGALATLIAMLINHFYPHQLVALLYSGAIPSWLTRPLLPPGLILMAAALSLMGFVLARYRERLITGLATRWIAWRGATPPAQERVLIIGCGESGRFAAWMLSQGQYAKTLRVVGFVDDDFYKKDARIHGAPVLGRRNQIPRLVSQYDIGIIVFAIHNISSDNRRKLLEICNNTSARVILFPDIAAAINNLARHNGATREIEDLGSFPHGVAAQYNNPLPCNLCLTKVSPLKVDGWLAQLEEIAHCGDLASLQTQVRYYRSQLQADVTAQLAINLAGEELPS
jgi:lipopolysaccharide/colanic/teichoic acid biosynthesis glycosyltransferase